MRPRTPFPGSTPGRVADGGGSPNPPTRPVIQPAYPRPVDARASAARSGAPSTQNVSPGISATAAALRRPLTPSPASGPMGTSSNATGLGAPPRGQGSAGVPVRPGHRVAGNLPPQPRPGAISSRPSEPEPPMMAAAPSGLPPVHGAGRQAPAPSTPVNVPITPHPAPAARLAMDAGSPVPPISGRPLDSFGSSVVAQKRIAPRSPRTALEPEHVPMPTRRSKRARNPLVIVGNAIFTLLILAVIGGAVAFGVGKHRFEAPGPLGEDKVVNIPARAGIWDIAEVLRREGVMDEHSAIFVGGAVALKARTELKSGEYLFPKRASVRDVVETMVEGKVVQHSLTIPEGLTSEQIVRRLLDSEVLAGNIKDVPHEGTLLPESYRFPRGMPRDQVLQRMQREQRRIVQETWDRRVPDLPLKTPEQLVILASIIEKETSKPEERTRVASVFINRLKQRKRLESDPTIIYGLVGGKGALGHPITKSEKETPTPYNTYMIDGLPPGPIANPGRASIEAAANPARTKEMFFVADGTGGHVFAETYDQHLRNVARLRVIEQGERGSASAFAPEPEPAASPPARANTPAAKQKRASGAKKQ
ncbi:MAG: hypothetical protein QOG83_1956 [Alphaproteobacteria bacterium]|nr:hypothetical protein [Alphaproteobacteria bacterium]